MAFKKVALTTFLTNLGIQVCNVISEVIAARLLQPEGRGGLAADDFIVPIREAEGHSREDREAYQKARTFELDVLKSPVATP